LKKVLERPPEGRAALASSLLESLDIESIRLPKTIGSSRSRGELLIQAKSRLSHGLKLAARFPNS
jgi:hypothetical protein